MRIPRSRCGDAATDRSTWVFRIAAASRPRALAAELAELPVDAVISSPRRRAYDTAVAIADRHGLAVECVEAVRELDFGELEGRTYDEIAEEQPELFERWMRSPTTVKFPGGESYAVLRARAVAELDRLVASRAGQTVVLVTHGGVVRAIVAEMLGVAPERIFRIGSSDRVGHADRVGRW